ncbi:MAG TPA: hypothetical protein VGE07_04530 [Herpetosiphonaceae bacterium]
MNIDLNALGLGDQAITNLFIGFGLALLNVIIIYFLRFVPRVVSVLRWHKPGRSYARLLIGAYLVALAFQVFSSPFFRSLLHSVYNELAWSFYQAFWNVAGILLMDVIVLAWTKTRRGVQVGGEQLKQVRQKAADTLEDLGAQLPISAEGRAAQEERRKQQAAAELQEAAERKQRMDERLKNY